MDDMKHIRLGSSATHMDSNERIYCITIQVAPRVIADRQEVKGSLPEINGPTPGRAFAAERQLAVAFGLHFN